MTLKEQIEKENQRYFNLVVKSGYINFDKVYKDGAEYGFKLAIKLLALQSSGWALSAAQFLEQQEKLNV